MTQQQQIDFGRETLRRACERRGLSAVETALFLLGAEDNESRRVGRPVVLEGESCWRIDGSLRGVAVGLHCSPRGLKLALQRLEEKGLATYGSDRGGTAIVLCVGRLFDPHAEDLSEPEMDRPLRLPPREGAQPVGSGRVAGAECGADSGADSPSVPLGKISLSSSVNPFPFPLKAGGVPNSPENSPQNFYRRDDLLPWDRERLTDADLITLHLPMLRALFRESVSGGRLKLTDGLRFLAAAAHCARHPQLDGKRAKVLCGRIVRGNFSRLTDAAWDWARAIHPTAGLGAGGDAASQIAALEAIKR